LYADGTCLLHILQDNADVAPINADLASISDWAAQWRVIFSATKTVYMIFSKQLIRPSPLRIFFYGIPIKQVRTHCHLGLHFADDLSWATHLDHVRFGVSKSIGLLKRMSKTISRKTKLCIYLLYIRPKLEYANIVYGNNLTEAQQKSLEDLQRHALLSCTGAYQHTSHTRLLMECGAEHLLARRK
jgi:hypothetical protein